MAIWHRQIGKVGKSKLIMNTLDLGIKSIIYFMIKPYPVNRMVYGNRDREICTSHTICNIYTMASRCVSAI